MAPRYIHNLPHLHIRSIPRIMEELPKSKEHVCLDDITMSQHVQIPATAVLNDLCALMHPLFTSVQVSIYKQTKQLISLYIQFISETL